MFCLPKISPASQPLSIDTGAETDERIPVDRWLVLVAGLAYLICGYLLVKAWYLLASADPLWLDELHTDWLVSGRFEEIFARSLRWNQTPLYFWLEWIVVGWVGNSAIGLRLISVISLTLTVLAVAGVVGRWSGDWLVGFVTSGLLAVVSPIAFYASEARPYALLMLVAFLQTTWFVEKTQQSLLGRSSSRKSIFCGFVMTVIVIAVHPTGFLLLLVQLVVGVICSIRSRRGGGEALVLFPWCGVLLGSFASSLWLVGLRGTLEHRQTWTVSADLPGLVVWASWLGIWLLVPSGMACLLFRNRSRVGPSRAASKAGFITSSLGWSGLVAILACHQLGVFPVASLRYALLFLPLILSGWGLLLASIPNLLARTGLIGLAALGLVVLPQPFLSQGKLFWNRELNWSLEATVRGAVKQWRNEDWEPAREIFEKTPDANGAVIVLLCGNVLEDSLLAGDERRLAETFATELRFPLMRFSLGTSQRIDKIRPRATLRGPRFIDEDYREMLRDGKAFLVMRCEPFGPLHDEILNELRHGFDARGYKLETRILSRFGLFPMFVELFITKIE